ncbi:MAG: 2-hydroxychromene-2-carboxylate isomerase [Steroidobacteraceae bacterium]
MVSELPRVEFLFDFGSPNAFLSHRVIPAIEARTGVRFNYVPVLLGGIFKATGNQSPATAFGHIRNKPEYERLEVERFVRKHGIKGFAYSPFFPVNTLNLMRGAIAARTLGVFERYVDEMYRHMWVDHKKLDDPAVLAAAMTESGFDAERLMAVSGTPAVKAELIANTERAVQRGVFGSPTFFVDDEMWFGKDRLDDVEQAILMKRGDR